MIGLPYGENDYDDTLSHFHLIPECYGRTDEQNWIWLGFEPDPDHSPDADLHRIFAFQRDI